MSAAGLTGARPSIHPPARVVALARPLPRGAAGRVRAVRLPLPLRRRAAGGPLDDPAAFEDLYFRVSQRLLVFLTRRTADADMAVDLWGETWARAFDRRGGFRGSTTAVEEAWMFGIGRRVLADYYKRGAAEQRAMHRLGLERDVLDDADLQRLERMAAIGDLRDILGEALGTMPDSQREALRLRVVEGLSYADMAEILGASEQTIRARVSRGLRALSTTISADRPDLDIPEGR